MANKADKAASRGEIPEYRAWCPDAGQTNAKGYTEVCSVDAPTAARMHAERMTSRDWRDASANTPRGEDPAAVILVYDPEAGCTHTFVVRRRMQPVFEVVT